MTIKGELGSEKPEKVRLDVHVGLLDKCNDILKWN